MKLPFFKEKHDSSDDSVKKAVKKPRRLSSMLLPEANPQPLTGLMTVTEREGFEKRPILKQRAQELSEKFPEPKTKVMKIILKIALWLNTYRYPLLGGFILFVLLWVAVITPFTKGIFEALGFPLWMHSFDEPPFEILTFIISTVAMVLSQVILFLQSRAEEKEVKKTSFDLSIGIETLESTDAILDRVNALSSRVEQILFIQDQLANLIALMAEIDKEYKPGEEELHHHVKEDEPEEVPVTKAEDEEAPPPKVERTGSVRKKSGLSAVAEPTKPVGMVGILP